MPDGHEPELRESSHPEADDPALIARLIDEFERAERDEGDIEAQEQSELDELFQRPWDEDEYDDGDDGDDEDDEDDEDDGPLTLSVIRESLAEARCDRAVEEKTHDHQEASWDRTNGRIANLQERFPNPDARPEVVDIELGGLHAVSELQCTAIERQELVVALAEHREQHYEALIAMARRIRHLEHLVAQERTPIYPSGPTTAISSLMLWVAVLAGVIFAGVGLNELTYVSDHPHAYGPAKVIAWACGAGLLVSIAVGGLARASGGSRGR